MDGTIDPQQSLAEAELLARLKLIDADYEAGRSSFSEYSGAGTPPLSQESWNSGGPNPATQQPARGAYPAMNYIPSPVAYVPALVPVPVPAPSPFAITEEILSGNALFAETQKHLRNIGRVNILVAGQTGVGKSTLINSVFGEKFAVTALGEPVTMYAEWFESDAVPLRILDTRGLEAKDYLETLEAMRAEIENSRAQKDERRQIHMAWVCIAAPSSRVQACEVDIVRVLNKYDIPAIVVLTKYDDDTEFAEVVSTVMATRHAKVQSIVGVRALAKARRGTEGLPDLVTATYEALPTAHRAAFAAAQQVNRQLNKSAAEDYVSLASAAAAASAVIPVPFADLVTLAPIQAGMLVGISGAFGLNLQREQILQLITTVLGCLAVTVVGGWAIGNVLKFIPGPGTILGAGLNATVAGGITRALGRSYIRFLDQFVHTNNRLPTPEEVFDLFPTFYKGSGVAK